MRKFLHWLIACLVLAALVCCVVINVRFNREKKYQDAMYLMENFWYQKAESAFLDMDGYKDSDILAARNRELVEINKKETKKLFEGTQKTVEYWCPEAKIGIRMLWDLDWGIDLYAQWELMDVGGINRTVADQFFGDTFMCACLIRYDTDTGEYFFTRFDGEEEIGVPSISMEIRFRGRQNEDGSLLLYNDRGEQYTFVMYSTYDPADYKPIIVNPELAGSINGTND